jgi:hypothetical protein
MIETIAVSSRIAFSTSASESVPFGLVHDRRMLDLGGDDVLLARRLQRRPDGRVIALRAATGEDDFLRRAAEQRRHFFPRLTQVTLHPLAEAVGAGGIAVILGQERHHGLEHLRRNARGGIIVEVDDVFPGCVHTNKGR